VLKLGLDNSVSSRVIGGWGLGRGLVWRASRREKEVYPRRGNKSVQRRVPLGGAQIDRRGQNELQTDAVEIRLAKTEHCPKTRAIKGGEGMERWGSSLGKHRTVC